MKQLTTTQKLLVLILCFFVGIIAITWIGNQGILNNALSLQKLTRNVMPTTLSLSAIKNGGAALQNASLKMALLESNYAARDEFVKILSERSAIWEQINTAWDTYDAIPRLDAEEQSLADSLAVSWREFKSLDNTIRQTIVELSQNNDVTRQKLLYQEFYQQLDRISPLVTDIQTQMDALIDLNSSVNQETYNQAINRVISTGNAVLLSSLAISAFLVVLSIVIWRSINKPLSELNRSIEDISSGRLAVAAPCQDLKNELGKVGRNIEILRHVAINKEIIQVELQKARDDLQDKNMFLESEVQARVKEIIAMQRLTRYFSPKLAERLITDEELYRVRIKNLTVFFVDIRGFTRLSDSVEPEVLLSMLNEYFEEMTQIAFSFGGTVGKFFGDTVMGFFGDPEECPNHAEMAVRMALQMQAKAMAVSQTSPLWRKYGLNIGIGIATGYVTVGNIGSERHKDYTVIGRLVNLAARLMEEAKPGQILVSSETGNLITGMFKTEVMGDIRVKGFDKPIQAYNVLA